MKIALAQINPTVGDLRGNAALITRCLEQAKAAGAGLAVFPELALTGYPPRDLLCRKDFLDAAEIVLQSMILPACRGVAAVVGAPARGDDGVLYNAALLVEDDAIRARGCKSLLPEYDVFDEARYFKPARSRKVTPWRGIGLGLTICEDIWNDKDSWSRARYEVDPVQELVAGGAELIINISASPYHLGKYAVRAAMLGSLARKHRRGILYVNQVGANDDLVFDGSSLALDASGAVVARAASFREDLVLVDTDVLAGGHEPGLAAAGVEGPEDAGWLRSALVLGIRDYLRKIGFSSAVVGLSGGIDSAVTCALAVEALGPGRVLGVAMPSRYSSPGSLADARDLAQNLGIEYREVPIESMFTAFLGALDSSRQPQQDLAEENIQARIRGSILMFISNREGHLVLTTGNKSELAVGYCTLYGDMCGGLAVLSDVSKTGVYQLARHINQSGEIIPRSSIDKAPSAELRPGQRDSDSLPPYDLLDEVLQAYIEEGRGPGEIVAAGCSPSMAWEIAKKVDRAEYKRMQAPPGLRVTTKAFGPGRRMPVARGWHDSQ
jgi:NAD+ synthase (glutamine-hydrolysing)